MADGRVTNRLNADSLQQRIWRWQIDTPPVGTASTSRASTAEITNFFVWLKNELMVAAGQDIYTTADTKNIERSMLHSLYPYDFPAVVTGLVTRLGQRGNYNPWRRQRRRAAVQKLWQLDTLLNSMPLAELCAYYPMGSSRILAHLESQKQVVADLLGARQLWRWENAEHTLRAALAAQGIIYLLGAPCILNDEAALLKMLAQYHQYASVTVQDLSVAREKIRTVLTVINALPIA